MDETDFADSAEAGRALLYAVDRGDGPLVLTLLRLGVDASSNPAYDDSVTPLVAAAANGHARITELLIAAGADIDACSHRLLTALMAARDYEIIKILLGSGANISASDPHGMTALIHQAGRGNLEGVNALLAMGADPNAKDHEGCTALAKAILGGYGDVQEALIAAGADPVVKGNIGHVMYEPTSKVIFN